MAKKAKKARNLLEMVPCRTVETKTEEDGSLTLLRPKFLRGPFAWVLQPRLRKPNFKVHLDEMGARVWSLIDDERTVADVLEGLREQVGELEQDLDRLAFFLKELEGGGMIRYRPEEPREDDIR